MRLSFCLKSFAALFLFPILALTSLDAQESNPLKEAEAKRQSGDLAAAAGLFEKVLANTPDSKPAHRGLQKCLLGQGKEAEAIERYTQLLKANPRAPYYYLLGQVTPDPTEELKHYRQGLRKGGENFDTRFAMASAFYRIGKFPEARSQIRKALQASKSSHEAHLLHIEILRSANDKKAIGEYYKQLVGKNPGSAFHQLWWFYAVIEGGYLDRAEPVLEKALAIDSDNPDILRGRAVLQLRKRNLTEAQAELEKIFARFPNDGRTLRTLGQLRVSHGKDPSGLELLARAVQLDPRNPAALKALGSMQALNDRPVEAAAHLNKALQLSPLDADIHHNLGVLAAADERWEKAVEWNEKAIGLRRIPRYFVALGQAYGKLGNDEKAAAAFETAEALSPGLTPPAEKAMEAVFENGAYVLKPENAQSPGPALTKARELAREGKLAEAATTLENILTKPDARHLEALVTLARIQRRAGRHEDALASLTSAGNLCATHEQLKTQKGQIEAGKARSLYDLGRRDEAAALWQTLADQPSSVGASLDVKNLVKAAASEPTGKPVEFEVPTPKAKDRLKAGVAAILRFHQLEEAATKLEGLELREAGMVGGDLNGMLDEILPDDLAYRWFSGEESTLAALMEEKLPALLTYYALIPGEGYRGTAAIVHGFDPGIRSFHLNDSRWLDTTDRMTSDRAAECRALVIAPAAFFEKTKILFPDQAFWQNYNRAERLAAENRFEDTYKELKVALSIKPDSFLTHLFLSAAAKRIGKDNEAYSAAAEATRLSRFDARPASTLGSFHGRRKKIEEAQKSFEAALAIEPAFTEPREFLARTLITRRDLEKGLAEADQLRHRFPNRPTGHYLRGSILSGQGNYAEAEHCLTVAAQLGTRASILDNLATVQVNLNKLPQAIQTLKRLYAIAEPEAARKVIEAKITLLRRRAEEVR